MARDDLEAFKESGVLTELRTVFSRDDPASETRYVQHAIRESADKIAEILGRDDSVIYVCGDARNMSKDVNEAIVQALARAKGDLNFSWKFVGNGFETLFLCRNDSGQGQG